MKVLFIFEFAVPPYRRFVINAVSELVEKVQLVSGADRFDSSAFENLLCLPKLVGRGENIWYWLSPRFVLEADLVFTTFNFRRPHTWIYILLFPKRQWVLWGQGRWSTQNVVFRVLRSAIFRRSKGFIVYTESGRQNLIELGYPADQISIANNTLMVANSEATLGTDYFLYVGRLQERKEIDLAIRCLQETDHRLRVVGDGALKSYLVTVALDSGVADRVEFYPETFEESALKDHFSGALAYISPGHVGLGAVHAFAYGVPVITISTRFHAPEFEYCTNENSYLCADEKELDLVIKGFDGLSTSHLSKRRAAFAFYSNELAPEKMISCFKQHL